MTEFTNLKIKRNRKWRNKYLLSIQYLSLSRKYNSDSRDIDNNRCRVVNFAVTSILGDTLKSCEQPNSISVGKSGKTALKNTKKYLISLDHSFFLCV